MEHREEAVFWTEKVDLPVASWDVQDVVLGAFSWHCKREKTRQPVVQYSTQGEE